MFENPRRGRQARNFTTNVPKILDLKSSSEQIFSRKLSLGAPDDSFLDHWPWTSVSCRILSLYALFSDQKMEFPCKSSKSDYLVLVQL